MAVGNWLIDLIRNNKITLFYTLFLSVMPLIFSSGIVYSLTENYFFFQSLQWLDLGIVFVFFSFTMAFGLTPTTFICFLSGYIWGWIALVYILPSYLMAQTIGFYTARLFDGSNFLNYLIKLDKMPDFLSRFEASQRKIIVISRISPVLPFSIINLVMSILKVDFKNFTIFGLLGMLPRTLLVVWLGTQTQDFKSGVNSNIYYTIGLIALTLFTIWGLGKIFARK